MRGLPLVHFTMSLLFVGLGDTRSLKEGVPDLADNLNNEIQLRNRNQTSTETLSAEYKIEGEYSESNRYSDVKDNYMLKTESGELNLKEDNQVEEIMHNKDDETSNWVWDEIDGVENFSEREVNGNKLSIEDGNSVNGYEEYNNEKYIVNIYEVNQSYQHSKSDRFGVRVYLEYRKVKDEHNNSSLLLYVQIDTDDADVDYSIYLCRTCDTPTARVLTKATETAVATATPDATATATAKATGTSTAKATATATGTSTAAAISTASDTSIATTTSSSTGSARSTATSISTGNARATGTATATGSSTATTTSIATTTESASAIATSTASATDMATATGLAKTTSSSGATGKAAATVTATGSSTAITSSITTTTDTATGTATSTATATGSAKSTAEASATSKATARATATAKSTATGSDTDTDIVADIQPPPGDNRELVVVEKEIETITDKHYLCVMAADTPDQNLTQYFPLCNDFIHAARLRGGNVLIHCLAGMSRSVTVAVAYIMTVTSLSWKEALKVVRVGRSVANPNYGFQKQLQEFELYRLSEERRRLKERFPSLALAQSDEAECRIMLNSYQGLLNSKDLCEGKCAYGEVCPTGLCRSPSKRILRRKSSTTTPPQSPRMLPPTPTTHSYSSTSLASMSGPSTGRRPRSGPGGLSSYAGASAPHSRNGSRYDISGAVGSSLPPSRNGSRQDIHTVGIVGPSQPPQTSAPRRDRIPQSAPSSPQHFPRRMPAPLAVHEIDS